MNNVQDFVANTPMFRKFEVEGLLFVEFKCPIESSTTGFWCDNNFFAFILTGETLVRTPRGEYPLESGDCVFIKKGSILVESEYQEDFCELLIFVPDDFIRSVIRKYEIRSVVNAPGFETDAVFTFEKDNLIQSYFNSLLSYFNQEIPPTKTLLKLKFEELIVGILSVKKYLPINSYFCELCRSEQPSIKELMEANFTYNLSIPEFSRLCARSLSSFKVEFRKIYGTSPAKWLLQKRLEHTKYLLETSNKGIDEICLITGFENKSHFIKVFKNKYRVAPGKYRSQGQFF
ncbi:MAG TPA: AraC family transcriptional regulator [Cyclobacteriaceae bacterium]|nr:AraC family transcriptional regulator [Cyclobacteriaceae bacterium]